MVSLITLIIVYYSPFIFYMTFYNYFSSLQIKDLLGLNPDAQFEAYPVTATIFSKPLTLDLAAFIQQNVTQLQVALINNLHGKEIEDQNSD